MNWLCGVCVYVCVWLFVEALSDQNKTNASCTENIFPFNQLYEYSSGDYFFLVQMSLKTANWLTKFELVRLTFVTKLMSKPIDPIFCYFPPYYGRIKRHGSKYVRCLFIHYFISFISISLNFSLHELVFIFVVVAIVLHIQPNTL